MNCARTIGFVVLFVSGLAGYELKSAEPPQRKSNKTYWVTSDRLNRRTCPSTDCGIVGQNFFRQGVEVFEEQDGWVRISKYYDASCFDGVSEYVDRGNNRCDQKNGVVNGKLAEWVSTEFLSKIDRRTR